MMQPTPGQQLRCLIQRDQVLVVAGAFDAVSARLAERAGFEAVYMTGAGTVNAMTSLPDIGLLTQTEMATNARHMCGAVDVPVFADADTGYGNALNVIRTVREFEKAGLAGLHLEDQVAPKRCGHVEGKECVSLDEMVGKIRAAIAARRDPNFVIIARTDARQPLGFEEAVRRGLAYVEAGADVIFPEAMQTREELAAYARAVRAPLLANMTEFGKTPYLTAAELSQLGYKIVLFAASALRVAMKAMQDFYADLRASGTQVGWLERMMTRREQYEVLGYAEFTKYERDFVGTAVAPLA